MNHLKRFVQNVSNLAFFMTLFPGVASLAAYIMLSEFTSLDFVFVLAISAAICLVASIFSSSYLTKISTEPMSQIWQAIWHVSPGSSQTAAPRPDSLKIGRELVSSMVLQIYDFASKNTAQNSDASQAATTAVAAGDILEQMPLAVFVLSKESSVVKVNAAGRNFLSLPIEKIIGKPVYDVLRMSFTSDDTFDNWLKSVGTTRATASRSWEHVRATIEDKKELKQFDLAASYSKDDPSGNEVVLAVFDRSEHYDRQDGASSYVAMAVHELRTPLTLLRGYIELFEEELGPTLSPEHKAFMVKMNAAAQSLTAFVSNILNVARVDENQMTLQLHEGNWNEVLPAIISDLELRAAVRGKKLELKIDPDLPAVAIDRISMYEVVSNLVDNAIKYSGESERIVVYSRKSSDNAVETVVEDFGPGMPESTISQLFTKFYRSHRSRGFVGGSGLGLYLVKSIITAHGGHVWVQSTEGQGSKFGFTLQTFASISDGTKAADGIERQAGGWIKNHSMYRR